jgi:hypothetical protein
MKYKKGKGFLDEIGNLSFNQQGPAWGKGIAKKGKGFAPPYGGALLGADGRGRRMMTAGKIGKKRGRGVLDHIKSAWNYIKGNKDIQKYGKEGLKYLGGHAKELIKAKVDSLKRKFKKENRTPKEKTIDKIPIAPIGTPAKEVKLPETKPALTRSMSLKTRREYEHALKSSMARGIKKRGIKKIMLKKRKGGTIRPHYKARGIPPLPPGLRA